jgi:uncharacterized protein YndB with AHSA1/START domain
MKRGTSFGVWLTSGAGRRRLPLRARLVITVPDEPAGDPIEVDFEQVAGGATRMTLTQTAGEFTAEQREMTIEGWSSFFDVMEGLVAPAI